MAAEIALVHLGAGLDFLGLGIDQVPPQLLEEILTTFHGATVSDLLVLSDSFELLVRNRPPKPVCRPRLITCSPIEVRRDPSNLLTERHVSTHWITRFVLKLPKKS